jgi:hypothetical protein
MKLFNAPQKENIYKPGKMKEAFFKLENEKCYFILNEFLKSIPFSLF